MTLVERFDSPGPKLPVVRKHEVLCDSSAESLDDPLVDVLRFPMIAVQAFDKAQDAFFDHFNG